MLNSWQSDGRFFQGCKRFAVRPFAVAFVLACCKPDAVLAQAIRADNSLSTNVSSPDMLNFVIDGGTQRGDNLFHSFDVFSVPSMGSAAFNNLADVTNIISRVTGGQSSRVEGVIRANGGANLFLINPDGIVFEKDARLDIGGSFMGTTASSVQFADRVSEFSAIAPNPLLNVSTPAGLQFGAASGDIRVNGGGYGVISELPLRLDSSSGLHVKSGNTIALVGNGVFLEGGVLAAPGGRVELGGVQQGGVAFATSNSAPNQWLLNYDDAQSFESVELSSQSLVNASSLLFSGTSQQPIGVGARGGSIQIQGHQVSVRDGSMALVHNFGPQASGGIRVRSSDVLSLEGTDGSQAINSGFATASFSSGLGGAIDVDARRLYFTGGAEIVTETFGTGASGNLLVRARDDIHFDLDVAANPESGRIFSISYVSGNVGDIDVAVSNGPLVIEDSGIASQNVGSGIGGAVRVSAETIVLTNAGSIASAALGSGPGGDVVVTANAIDVLGVDPNTFFPTTIAVSATNSGAAGSLTINAQRLRLRDGGRVDASTFAAGNAGTVKINATEFVEVVGTVPGSINPSLISSGANAIDPALRAFFEGQNIFVPALPSGDSGDVTIDTPRLTVAEGAQVTVRNDGSGNAGLLTVVNADVVQLLDNGGITASTQQGSGGNIRIEARDVLLLRRGSQISAEAGNAGDGGNISLTTANLVALENSDIIANAFQGAGGNIQVNAQGILGTQLRDQLTAESDITASSKFGVSGVVEVTTLEAAPSDGIGALSEDVVSVDNQISVGCSAAESSQFVASGRGGFPSAPTVQTDANRPWQDVRSVAGSGELDELRNLPGNFSEVLSSETVADRRITEATSWARNSQGEVSLVTANDSPLAGLAVADCLQPTV